MSETDRNSYSSILKSIGLFGGVKVFQILVSIIRNKIIAVLLGPIGIGLSGMITSTTDLVNSLFSCGLHTSSVREIARAVNSKNTNHISTIIYVLRRLLLITGLFATIISFIFAPQLSQLSFGNSDYTIAFRIVSVILFFNQISLGQTAIMQGTFHYKYMAFSGLIGNIIGLFVSIPFYFLYGEDAIVPVIVLSSLIQLIVTTYYAKKVKVEPVQMSFRQVLSVGKSMLVLGFAIALSGILSTGQTYLLRGFIINFGSIADVGLYIAGISIATQYVDLIFQAMGTDYAPRLASVSDDNDEFRTVVNRQIKLMMTLVTPLIIPFILFISQFISLLYSNQFLPILGMIEWVMFGMFFRAFSWCLSYTIVAKGEAKRFFTNELLTKVYSLAFSMIGYYIYGFTGMGVAFCLTYVFYSLHMYILCYRMFEMSFSKDVLNTIIVNFIMMLISFIIFKLLADTIYRYIFGVILLIIVWYFSFHMINQMIPVKVVINKFLNKLVGKNKI